MIASLLDADSLKLYTLIWSRAVACQMEPASIAQVICAIFTSNHAYSVKYVTVVSHLPILTD